MTRQIPLLINGEIVKSTSGQTLPVLNPSTQELLGEVPFDARQEIETAVARLDRSVLSAAGRLPGVGTTPWGRSVHRRIRRRRQPQNETGVAV